MTKRLLLELESKHGAQATAFEVEEVLCAGYAGRNQEKVMEHIRELEKIGVKPPPSVPVIYSVPSHQAVTDPAVTVHGDRTSGEVEFVLIMDGERILVTVGSDHTDRELETDDILKSKEVCPKPLAPRVWDYEEVAGHWDSLVLRSWVTDSSGRRLYQQHDLTALLRVDDLLTAVIKATAGGKVKAGAATTVAGETIDHAKESLKGRLIFSGTVPTREGFVFGREFEMELHDPVLGRSIFYKYLINFAEE